MSSSFLAETFQRMLDEQMPNLFRLHISPYVVQTCLCLSRYVADAWPSRQGSAEEHQSFLANSFDEALSGAIKLARYACCLAGQPIPALILDPGRRCGSFAATQVREDRVEFVPGVTVVNENESPGDAAQCGTLVLVADERLEKQEQIAHELIRRENPLLIVCINRASLDELRRGRLVLASRTDARYRRLRRIVRRSRGSFGAFTAKKELYDLESSRQIHIPFDHFPAQYNLRFAFRALPGAG